ncbi:hypothetical protein OHA72_49480 [Dactylosporangium sp. NBC_01737]|uniref:hypothetical protein n=1 Tax=Dactylosporangium sp. NBC_01737 TaxID=2975959 RepID=UPI002E0EA63E|nr:hypothetical protein OHA72_49480 [Dactylosporangium sp. NBC_01737]
MSHELFRDVEFPFADGRFPHHLSALVQRTVFTGAEPVREVVHTRDNSWLVGDGVNDPNLPGAALVDSMSHIALDDPSVAGLADLPPGHITQRAEPHTPCAAKSPMGDVEHHGARGDQVTTC